MAAATILYLPGLFGSRLTIGPPSFPFPLLIWVSPLSVISGIVIQLQLATDGVSPGPATDGYPVAADGAIDEFYAPLATYLEEQGWTVRRSSYDWRMSLATIAARVVLDITLNLRGVPIVFVAHSYGGLVARAVYSLLLAAGQAGQVQGIITLGTPHYGSLVPVQTWFGVAEFYQRLAQVVGKLFPAGRFGRLAMLDLISATWPSLYTCMSFRDSGPLFRLNPAAAAAIYVLGNYSFGNQYLQSGSLDAAVVSQTNLQLNLDASVLRCIASRGVRTPVNLDLSAGLSSPNAFLFSDDGDGIVPIDSAIVPGSQSLILKGVSHELLPQSPACWGAVRFFVQQCVGLA